MSTFGEIPPMRYQHQHQELYPDTSNFDFGFENEQPDDSSSSHVTPVPSDNNRGKEHPTRSPLPSRRREQDERSTARPPSSAGPPQLPSHLRPPGASGVGAFAATRQIPRSTPNKSAPPSSAGPPPKPWRQREGSTTAARPSSVVGTAQQHMDHHGHHDHQHTAAATCSSAAAAASYYHPGHNPKAHPASLIRSLIDEASALAVQQRRIVAGLQTGEAADIGGLVGGPGRQMGVLVDKARALDGELRELWNGPCLEDEFQPRGGFEDLWLVLFGSRYQKPE